MISPIPSIFPLHAQYDSYEQEQRLSQLDALIQEKKQRILNECIELGANPPSQITSMQITRIDWLGRALKQYKDHLSSEDQAIVTQAYTVALDIKRKMILAASSHPGTTIYYDAVHAWDTVESATKMLWEYLTSERSYEKSSSKVPSSLFGPFSFELLLSILTSPDSLHEREKTFLEISLKGFRWTILDPETPQWMVIQSVKYLSYMIGRFWPQSLYEYAEEQQDLELLIKLDELIDTESQKRAKLE